MKRYSNNLIGILIAIAALCSTITVAAQADIEPKSDSTVAEKPNMASANDTTMANAKAEKYKSLPTESQEKEVSQKGDTTYISFGKKKVRIIERDGQTDVKIADKDDDEAIDWESDEDSKELFSDMDKDDKNKFKGHWSGMEIGLSNYINSSNSFNLTDDAAFMDLRTGRSWNVNLNFAQHSLGFASDRIGLVTGLGLEWSIYHFSDTNSIDMVNGQIVAAPIPESTTKNLFQTTYLTVPLILEWQFTGGEHDDRSYLGVGVIGGVNVFANTKIKYVKNGDKKKEKEKGGYNLSPVRFGFTARLGFKAFKLYANYYPTPLFKEGKGPELYPVAAGLVMSF